MHIKGKLYPYPVLAGFNDDYINSTFNISMSIQISPNNVKVSFIPELDNKEMLQLINDKKAQFIVHIESSLTSYRRVIVVPNEGTDVEIPADSVEGLISFCPFVVAVQDIDNFSSESFNPDYKDVTFEFEKGNILAIGKEVQLRLEKENDDLANVPSIFSVTEIKNPEVKNIIINVEGNKINIQLPTQSFKEFKLAMANPKSMSVIHSMIIIPALMKCFEEIKARFIEERFMFEGKRWYRVVKKVLGKIGIELETEEDIKAINSFDYAQNLMDNTTMRALTNINDIAYKGDIEDD